MPGVARVGWVRVELGDDGPVCHVVGTHRHRLVMRRVPLAQATALIAGGVPSVIRHPRIHRRTPAHT